jgi:16S rRNA (cytidine1402-2'-O)-methyltransferase
LNAGPALLVQAAEHAASGQSHLVSTLYVVATPIGNLADISLRALYLLAHADTLACEDTRHTQQLLRSYGLERSSTALLAVHQHNEAQAAQQVLERLARGERVAYVSDAGTPAISDPGARLVAAVRAAGYRIMPLPGASSVTTLLSASGMTGEGGFVFQGFLPSKATERERAVQTLSQERRAVVLLEAPHRIEATAKALAPLGERLVTIGRELTKQFEQIHTVAAQDLHAWLCERPEHQRGEFALVVHENTAADTATGDGDRVLQLLLPELPLKTAVRLAAEISGESKNTLYERALQLKNQGS